MPEEFGIGGFTLKTHQNVFLHAMSEEFDSVTITVHFAFVFAKTRWGKGVKQIDVSFLCVCPVIDHEFRHNIVKVAVDPQTSLAML